MLVKGRWSGRWRCSVAFCSLAANLVFHCAAAASGSSNYWAPGDACPAYFSSFSNDAGASELCTTTTFTTTTTTITTTRANTTTTSTSSPQPWECRLYCAGNGHQWFIKCGWPTCASCMECNTLVIPNPPAPGSAPPGSGPSPSTSPSPQTAAPTPAPGSGSAPVPAPTPAPPPVVPTGRRRRSPTTTMTTRAPWCIDSCRASTLPWSMLCTWATCMDCDECFPFTTTETSTGTTTTFTSTFTTSTDTLTSTTVTTTTTFSTTTRTTYPGETITWTSTTSHTTSSTTSTTTETETFTTTTMTTTGMECSPPSPLLPTDDCQHNITAGGLCRARTFRTDCVDQSELIFLCAVNNTNHEEPAVVSGTYAVHCQICGMLSVTLTDSDPRPGIISSVIRFGPNAIGGIVNETEILGYAVFMVDECGRTVGDVIAYAPRRPPKREFCCQHDAYTLPLFARMPFNATGVAFTVLPNTTGGLLPIGALTELVLDDVSRPVGAVATWSGARRCGRGGAAWLTVVCMGAWLASVA